MEEELIIGKNPVLEALQNKRSINKILIAEQIDHKLKDKITKHVGKTGTIIQKVPKKKIDQLTKGNHQGVVAYVSPYSYQSVEEILQNAKDRQELPFVLILDELTDPHNLGAILRTADATGVHGIIIPKRRSVLLNQTVAKTSAGAIEHIPVARVTNISRTIDMLKTEQIWVIGTDESGERDFRLLDGETAVALVIGNEGKGISRLVKEKCDWHIHLPMKGSIPSLNASVAASLLMYEVFRKRSPNEEI